MRTTPTRILRWGAWAMPDSEVAAHKNGIANALDPGYAVLASSGTAALACRYPPFC